MSKRLLLDTNILVHRERGDIIYIQEIGTLFNWIDRLKYEKCIHPDSLQEIDRHRDSTVRETMQLKIKQYNVLKTLSSDDDVICELRLKYDKTDNDKTDTSLLLEVYNKRVDYLITEDRKIHTKASLINVSDKVFTVESFLEKCVSESPDLTDYKVLSVRRVLFGQLKISNPFFDTFKRDYVEFADWFNKKSDNPAYVCYSDKELLAFLFIKVETEEEPYHNIFPAFAPGRRLKIGTFKVAINGHKLGERFLKIIFDNALKQRVQEIYVTIFRKTAEQELLVKLLEDWGFVYHGIKRTENGEEDVFTRNFHPRFIPNDPQKSYPYISRSKDTYIVPIRPDYHTELLPDSILTTESPANFIENKPNRNAIRKVYISRSIERGMNRGDIVIFYRTKGDSPAYYTAVATTIGIIESVILDIRDEEQFLNLCRKRSVFSDEELREYWNFNPNSRPFIVNFLYVYSLPTPKLTLRDLQNHGIIASAPRGFERISQNAFNTLIEKSNAEKNFIVD